MSSSVKIPVVLPVPTNVPIVSKLSEIEKDKIITKTETNPAGLENSSPKPCVKAIPNQPL